MSIVTQMPQLMSPVVDSCYSYRKISSPRTVPPDDGALGVSFSLGSGEIGSDIENAVL